MVFQKAAPQKRTVSAILAEVVARTNDNTQRLRMAEQRIDSLISRLQIVEQEIIDYRSEMKKMSAEAKSNAASQEKRLADIERSIKEIVSQLKKMPTKIDVAKVEELVGIYNPLKSDFVTREELERALSRRK